MVAQLLEEFRSMPNQVLAATVTRVLTHEAIMSVNFELNGLVVTGVRYQAVVRAIAGGKITCEVGVAQDPNLPAGSFAECLYDQKPSPRQLRFPNEQYGSSSGREKFNIVHEATHALFDCYYGNAAGKQILAIDDEAAAWLAEALYSRISPFMWGGPIIQGDPLDEALKLADKIMAVPGMFGRNSRTYTVPPADATQLRDSVKILYSLQDGRAGIVDVFYGMPP
jgi:hypothetical protein